MKKIILLSLFLGAFLSSCGGSKSEQNTDNQMIEEAIKLDSLSSQLDETIQEIDKSEAELNAALEALDD